MSKKGKKHKEEQLYDDYYYDDVTPVATNTTSTPNDSLAPTPFVKSKKKKGKKGKKSKKSKKKKKKSKKGLESLSPSPSPGNATTVAPMGVATAVPVATNAPAVVAIPTANSGNGTTVTFAPSVQSKSKKKKKSKKGGKGKGATEATFQSAGSQPTQSPIPSDPAPASVRSKTSTYKTPTSIIATASKAPSINTAELPTSKTPSTKSAFTASKAPIASGPKNLTNTVINKAAATMFPSTLSPSPSPFPSLLLKDEQLSASPAPSLLLETVDASPFQLTYNIVTYEKLSNEQISAAVDASFTFLNDYLIDAFDVNNQITYDSLLGTRIAHSVDYTTVQYMAAARFVIVESDATTYLPATSEIDAMIEMAFNPTSTATLLDMLGNLPPDNPYSQTTAVTYASVTIESPSIVTDQPPPMDNGKTVAARVGISGAVLIICVCTGLVALYRWGYFKKIRRKRNKTNYNKAPKSASKSGSVQNKTNSSADKFGDVDDENDDDDVSMSDCTSSIRSRQPSSSTLDNDESYRSRILEEDVEIKFLYPTRAENMNCDASMDDPLFPSSPLISQDDYGKKRHNI